ncbi:MAG: 6-phosphogluconolactonase [Bacteroidales bacterium]|nr:6-phosphogluconolactonase [Bacteroidales bacterium]
MERKSNYIYPDQDTLIAAFVCEFLRYIEEETEEGKHLHIALSGGSTPLAIFKQLAEQSKQEDWSHVSLYWGDERCVPPDHPESNYGRAREALLEALDLDQDRIHRIRGEEPPPAEAERYGQELLKFLPNENGFPVFDWIWLGLGMDGHTASIFPQQIELWTAGSPCIVSSHPETDQPRISLTGGVINVARRVSFIASGSEKASVIRDIFRKEGRYAEYPAFYVNPPGGDLEWFLDQEASRLL